MGKELSLIDHQVLTKLSELGNWRSAIMEVYGYTEETKGLAQKVHNKKARIMKVAHLTHYLEAHNLGHARLANKLDQLLEAKKTVGAGRTEEGELLTQETPDYQIQMRAVDLLAEIVGAKQKQKSQKIGTQVNQLIAVTETVEAAQKTAKMIEEHYGKEMTNPDYKVEEMRDGEAVG